MKNLNKNRIIIAICLFVAVLVSVIVFSILFRNKKTLKFSIDDASIILEDIIRSDYESIFDSEYLSALKSLHDKYALDVTLFVFERTEYCSINDFPDRYLGEFEANSDWLKFAWHGLDENDPSEAGYTCEELIDSYDNTTAQIVRFAGKRAVSKEMRLHFWYSGYDEFLNHLTEQGVKTLYYPDTDVLGYDFTEDEDEAFRAGTKDSVKKKYGNKALAYQMTDIRLDNITSQEELEELLDEHSDEKTIVVFTHAWMLKDTEKYLETMCKWAQKNSYKMDWN